MCSPARAFCCSQTYNVWVRAVVQLVEGLMLVFDWAYRGSDQTIKAVVSVNIQSRTPGCLASEQQRRITAYTFL